MVRTHLVEKEIWRLTCEAYTKATGKSEHCHRGFLVDGYLLHSPNPYGRWFPFDPSPGNCGLVIQADTHLLVKCSICSRSPSMAIGCPQNGNKPSKSNMFLFPILPISSPKKLREAELKAISRLTVAATGLRGCTADCYVLAMSPAYVPAGCDQVRRVLI